jgi:hypothetical protein
MHAKSGEAVAETIGNLIVEKGEKTIASVHEGDVNAEGFEDGGVFATDDAAADDREAFWDAVHLKKGVGVKSVDVVEGNLRGRWGLDPVEMRMTSPFRWRVALELATVTV